MSLFKNNKCLISIFLFSLILSGCASKGPKQITTPIPTLEQAQTEYRQGDFSQAMTSLTLLAIQGNPEAQYALGYMYYYGQGSRQNIELARGWFREASAQGYIPARQALNQIDRPVASAFPK